MQYKVLIAAVYRNPRLIHDVNSCCLLISRVYKCKHGHEILGHHPDILSRFIDGSLVPFRLYRQTGFTETLMSFIVSSVKSGNSTAA